MTPAFSLAGAALVVLAEFFFAAMGATVRHLSGELTNAQLVFARNAVGLLLLMPLLWNARRHLATRVPHLHLLRGLSGVAAMYCFYYAIANLPLAQAMLLKLSAPLFIPLIALFWLHESLTTRVVTAVCTGFLGVAIILAPDFAAMAGVSLVALLGGLFAALAKVAVRRLGRTEPPSRTVFYFALIASAVSAVPLAWSWEPVEAGWWPWLGLLGVLATLGQLALTRGFALAQAGTLAPFTYFSVVFGAVLGWLFWDEGLSLSTVLGSVLVMLAGLATARQGARASARTTPSGAAAALGEP